MSPAGGGEISNHKQLAPGPTARALLLLVSLLRDFPEPCDVEPYRSACQKGQGAGTLPGTLSPLHPPPPPPPLLSAPAFAGTPSSYTCAVSAGLASCGGTSRCFASRNARTHLVRFASLAIKSCDGGRGRNVGMAEAAYRNLANRDAGKKQTPQPKIQHGNSAGGQPSTNSTKWKNQGKKSINEEKTSSFIRPQHVRWLSPTVTRWSLAHKLS